MHITLISTDDEKWASGMRGISSVLRKAGHETTMIFAGSSKFPVDRSLIQRISELAKDSTIIGISSMSRGSERAKEIIKGLRPLGKIIVWGGVHPTLFPEDCVRYVDVVCRGEGEDFILDLVERVASGISITDISSGAFLSNDIVKLNDMRPLASDLDSLPLLDYSFDKEYVLDQTGVLLPNKHMVNQRVLLFSGSRGCNNSCTYCSNSQLKTMYKGCGRFTRKMSIRHLIKSINEYQKMFPMMAYIQFTDEDLLARPIEELREFADIYPSQVGLPFQCMAAPNQINEEKIALVTAAGLVAINIGLESGSERTRLEIFNRKISDEKQMQAAIAISKHPQVSPTYFLIIGNPYEEREDLINGIRFLEKMPYPFSLTIYNLVFIPGTKLYYKAIEDGVIEGQKDSASNLDFLGGYDYRTHSWKRKNLYLNSILSVMSGRFTKRRLGLIPRKSIPFLLSPQVVDFCDRHVMCGKSIAALGLVQAYPLRSRSD